MQEKTKNKKAKVTKESSSNASLMTVTKRKKTPFSGKLIKATIAVPEVLEALEAERIRRGRPKQEVTLQAVSARIEPEILEAMERLNIKRNSLINTLLRQHLESIGAI